MLRMMGWDGVGWCGVKNVLPLHTHRSVSLFSCYPYVMLCNVLLNWLLRCKVFLKLDAGHAVCGLQLESLEAYLPKKKLLKDPFTKFLSPFFHNKSIHGLDEKWWKNGKCVCYGFFAPISQDLVMMQLALIRILQRGKKHIEDIDHRWRITPHEIALIWLQHRRHQNVTLTQGQNMSHEPN